MGEKGKGGHPPKGFQDFQQKHRDSVSSRVTWQPRVPSISTASYTNKEKLRITKEDKKKNQIRKQR